MYARLMVLACLTFASTEALWHRKHVERKQGSRVTDDLKFLVVVSRHGNRGGTEDYPYDPYPISNTHYWPYGANGLTTRGRQQMHKLGVKVRSLYDGFLNNVYLPEEILATSTDVDRTLMSGESFLSGLYPPTGFQLWNRFIHWQPVSLHSNSSDKTPEILTCPKFKTLLAGIVKDFLGTYGQNITTMIKYFNEETGLNVTGFSAAEALYKLGDKLISEATEGYKIPSWTTILYPEPLLNLVSQVYLNYFAGTDEQVRLVIGTFFTDIVKVLNSKVEGSLGEERRIHYYSGHDSSLVTLQRVFGIPRSSVVGLVRPGSAILLEMHQNATTDQYYVEPLYIDGSTSDLLPEPLNLVLCGGSSCDFDTFLDITRNFTEVDYAAECQQDITSEVVGEHLHLNPFA